MHGTSTQWFSVILHEGLFFCMRIRFFLFFLWTTNRAYCQNIEWHSRFVLFFQKHTHSPTSKPSQRFIALFTAAN